MSNGDCEVCGHAAGTYETRNEQECERRGQHITDEI